MRNVNIINEDLFSIGKYEFIKFISDDGNVIGVLKDSFGEMHFGNNNDFSKSYILKILKEEFLPYIESIVGKENLLEFKTDLISLDGSVKHGFLLSKVSIPNLDFYQKNRSIFARHHLDVCWWLSTPDSTSEFESDKWVRFVTRTGRVDSCLHCFFNFGVRPMCIFNSDIFLF